MSARAFSRGDHVELAGALLMAIGEHVVADLGSLHTYDEAVGFWRAVPNARQSLIVQGFAGSPTGERANLLQVSAGDVSGATRLALDQAASPGFFDGGACGIAFANGFARVDENGITLEAHAREHRCRFGLPFAYGGESSATWDRFIRGLFRDDNDATEKIDCLGEFFGASLLGLATRFQQAIVAVGGGEQGKSTLAKIVAAAFPANALCAIPPQSLGNEYRRALLAGKRLNVVSELPEAEILASESFKAVITGDPIDGRHIREAPFTFCPEAGHYYAANRLPGTNDQSEGFWRRFIVIGFNRSFKDDPERDPTIAARIVRDELPAVARWALEGAARVIRQGRYTLPASHTKALAEWRLNSDQVARFLAERTEPDPSAATGSADLYRAYRAWATDAGHKNLLASNAFGARLKGLGWTPVKTERANVYRLRMTATGGFLGFG